MLFIHIYVCTKYRNVAAATWHASPALYLSVPHYGMVTSFSKFTKKGTSEKGISYTPMYFH